MPLPDGWQVFESPQQVAQAALQDILKVSVVAIAERGRFNLVTAGGTTPNLIYQLMADLESSVTDWSVWHIYMGDERVLAADDAERNSKVLQDIWLKDSFIPRENWHLMQTELGLEASAEDYRSQIAGVTFDVVMLGMGEDGHTASLFPGHACEVVEGVLCERESPKPPAQRISLSTETLGQTHLLLKIITGASKQPAIQQWLAGDALPISLVTTHGIERVLLDQSALPA